MTRGTDTSGSALDEPELADDYPMYNGFLYVCDGVVWDAHESLTVDQFKSRHGVSEVKRCDIFGRAARAREQGDGE